jgi:hypothetical protein
MPSPELGEAAGPDGRSVPRERKDVGHRVQYCRSVAEFEGPRMPPTATFTRSDPQHLARLLERTPVGSYDKAANQLFTSVHTWLVRDDAGMVLLVDLVSET